MMLDHMVYLNPKIISAIYRDMNTCEISQREDNKRLCRKRLAAWLHDHGMDSRTGLPHTGRPKERKVA